MSARERKDDTERFSSPYGGMYRSFALLFCLPVPKDAEVRYNVGEGIR